MSKRSLLNLTSTKKRDTMMYYNPLLPSSLARTITSSANPFDLSIFLFAVTARNQTPDIVTPDRNSSTPFYRGYSETITFTTNTEAPWRWRRIVFAAKGLQPEDSFSLTSRGYTRVMLPWADAATLSQLFKGRSGSDFNDLMDASTDRNRIRVLYDKTRTLRSGSGPHHHRFKMWHPINKTIHYDEDEFANTEDTSPWSTTGSRGLGDVFILDLFNSPISSTENTLVIKPQGTLYWHEK